MKRTDPVATFQGPDFRGPAFLAASVVLFYWKVLFDGQIFVFVDASRFFYPLWKWGAEVLQGGFIPLWDQDAQFGLPYLADPQMACAYPPVFFLYSWLSPVNAFASLIILHHLWALWGFWFFARKQGFSQSVSFLGALFFGFSLHVVCSSWTPPALMAISWIPWVFIGAERVFQKEKGGFLLLSFTWAMQLAAGYPVLTYLTGLALLLHLGWRRFRNKDLQWPVWMGWFAGAGLIAVVYNLVWGLPFTELLRSSNYEGGAGKFHDLNFMDLATALNPFAQGHPLRSDYHGPHYWVSTYFMGLPALCLLLWGALNQAFRKVSPVSFTVLLVLSLGVIGAGKVLKSVLPGYSLVVHSGFWISLLLFWAAWMVMESLEAFLGAKKAVSGKWFGVVGVLYLAAYSLGKPLFPGDFFISAGLLLLAPFLKTVQVRWYAFLAATVLSLGSAAHSMNILMERSYYEKPPEVLSYLAKPGRLFFTPPLMREAVKLQGESMSKAYEDAKQKLYPNWPLAFGREQAPLYNTLQLKSSFGWTFDVFQRSPRMSRGVLDYLNVRYVFGKNSFRDFRVLGLAGGAVEVSENPSALSKWSSVGKALAAGNSLEEDLPRLERMDLGKDCLIADPAKAGVYHSRKVTVQTRWPNRLAFTAEGSGKALVVSSETDFPGWKVRVEGKERTVERINHAFRGVLLEEKETRAVFSYEPLSFRLGLFLSLLVLGLWTGSLLRRFGE